MRKLISFLIAISISLTLCAQDVCIPDSTASKIIDELIVKDHLQFTVNRQDSIITFLVKEVNAKDREITIYKTKDETYNKIIKDLEEVVRIREAQIADNKKHYVKSKWKAVKIMILEGISIVVLSWAYITK